MQDILIFLYFWNHLRVKSVMLSRRYQIKYDGVCIFRLIAYRYLFDEKNGFMLSQAKHLILKCN